MKKAIVGFDHLISCLLGHSYYNGSYPRDRFFNLARLVIEDLYDIDIFVFNETENMIFTQDDLVPFAVGRKMGSSNFGTPTRPISATTFFDGTFLYQRSHLHPVIGDIWKRTRRILEMMREDKKIIFSVSETDKVDELRLKDYRVFYNQGWFDPVEEPPSGINLRHWIPMIALEREYLQREKTANIQIMKSIRELVESK